MALRSIARVMTATKRREGGGFVVRSPFPNQHMDSVGGAFLLLDHLGPITYAPGEAVGAPDHPHRGFITFTYVIEGSMQHKDSAGHHGTLSSGGAQYMVAGSGVVHAEMPSAAMMRDGGTMAGFQLWINLPKAMKMMPPQYQDVSPEGMPTVTVPGTASGSSTVKVLIGEAFGAKSVVKPVTPVAVYDVRVAPGDVVNIPINPAFVGVAYVYAGKAAFGDGGKPALVEGQAVVLGDAGDTVRVSAPKDSEARVYLATGEPIDEPIARYGPFVMNTQAEIRQAFDDYQNGRLGEIPGAAERAAEARAAKESQKKSGTWSRDNAEL